MHILIVGDPNDLSAVYMTWLARQRGFDVLELNEASLGEEWSFFYTDSQPAAGYIEILGERHGLASFAGAFVRLNPEPGLPGTLSLPAQEKSVLVVERRHAMQHFLNSLPFPVANYPFSGRSNGSKPYQMHLLTRAGFQVPKWTASNDRQRIEEFTRDCSQGAIYKSCSGLRSKVRMLDEEVFGRLQRGTSPVIVQEYIKGYDVRVHVVQQQIFATRVNSHGIDYRFESENNEFRATEVPDRIRELCIAFAAADGLTIGGFDFRVDEQGRWYCLEVNPVPTFIPYEMTTGQPIGNAILDVFVEGMRQQKANSHVLVNP